MEGDKTRVTIPINPDYFPSKLWCLVNNPGIQSICWDTSGTGIVIDEDRFKTEVLFSPDQSKYFKTKDFDSVVRQLNLYGFRKVRSDRDRLEKELSSASIMSQLHHFQNPNFKRGNPERLVNVKRLTRHNKSKLASGLEVPSYFRQSLLNVPQEKPGSNLVEHPRPPNHNNSNGSFLIHHGEQRSVFRHSSMSTTYACLPGPGNPSVITPYSQSEFYVPGFSAYQYTFPNSSCSCMICSRQSVASSTHSGCCCQCHSMSHRVSST